MSVCFNSSLTIELPSKKSRLMLGIIWKCLLTKKLFMNLPRGKKGSMRSRLREFKLNKIKHRTNISQISLSSNKLFVL